VNQARHPGDMGVANIKSCKKGAKSARINLQHLTALNPRKNSVLLAKFDANRTNGFQDTGVANIKRGRKALKIKKVI
jgi:hypothetical protein